MIPASAPAYVTTPTSPPKHATIDDNTGYAVLPVDPSRAAYLTFTGTWGDAEYGPDATTVELRTLAGKRWGEYRLTRDASFILPEATERVDLKVVDRCQGMSLVLRVYQPEPKSPARVSAPAPKPSAAPTHEIMPRPLRRLPPPPRLPMRATVLAPVIIPAPPCVEPATSPASTPPPRRPRGQRGGRGRRSHHHGALEQQATFDTVE
jgi:hypothetical protein